MLPLLVLAALAGATLSAIAGLGGGTLLIAVMFAVGLTPAIAVPLHAAVQLASNASRALAFRRHVHWPSAGWFLLSCAPLPFLTASWVARADADLIRVFLSGVILLSMWPAAIEPLARTGFGLRGKMLTAGALNGAIGMVIGATGLVIGPFFLDKSWAKETTVATLAVCQCLGHALKILAFGALGFGVLQNWNLLWPLLIAVALGTVIGRMAHGVLSPGQFRRLFKLILLLLAVQLGVEGLWGLSGGG